MPCPYRVLVSDGEKEQNGEMNDDGVVIKFNHAAFRHGVTEADIHWAFDTARVFHAMKCRNTYIHLIDSRRL
jgi:hypothetical protein